MSPLSLAHGLFLSSFVAVARSRPPVLAPVFALLIVLGFASPASAATLNVPGTYSTIQGAINVAVDGDTVLVDNGTYVENIDFLGKNITVTSVNGASVTTIDGSNATNPTVKVITGETSALLEGFTITGGSGVVGGPVAVGGGVLIGGATATVQDCWITLNSNPGFVMYGAGIAVSSVDTSAVIRRNKIYGNSGFSGSGIVVASTAKAEIFNNEIYDNDAIDVGGGIALYSDSETSIKRNWIHDNDALIGGGIYMFSSTTKIALNRIESNVATDGGGVAISFADDGAIESCVIHGNTASDEGGGLYIWNSDKFEVRNLIITKNLADVGAGVFVLDSGNTLEYLTVADCSATTSGGGIHTDTAAPDVTTIQYGIFWDNDPDEIDYVVAPVVDWCDIQGGLAIATNSIDRDPLFDTNHHLTAGSSCIDAITTTTPNARDIENDARPLDGDDDGTAYADMGADEYYVRFLRGDFDNDGDVDGGDLAGVLRYLFFMGPAAACERAADADDDGSINIADSTAISTWINLGVSLPAPFPRCSYDQTPDTLTCGASCP